MSSSKLVTSKESGFTLIELSIVLVIIGLIVGGILTGQDLIKAAEQRATIAQIEKYNTTVNTFRNKYNGIPGDLPFASANSFGLGVAGGTMTAGGDGNGLVQDGQAASGSTPTGEIVLFWQQLTQASLLDGAYGNSTTYVTLAGVSAGGTTANNFPVAKLGRGNYVTVGSSNAEGFNFFGMTGLASTFTPGASGTASYAAGTNNISPLEAYNMDKKVDDGMPNSGTVQARGATTAAITAAADIIQGPLGTAGPASPGAAAAAAGNCQMGSATLTLATNTYNVGASFGATPACSMRWRFN